MSPREAKVLAVVVGPTLALACGARDGLGFESHRDHRLPPQVPSEDASSDDSSRLEASAEDVRDRSEGAVEAGLPAAPDAEREGGRTVADCECAPDDYFMRITIDAVDWLLTAPYSQSLFCPEATVHFFETGCDPIVRVSGCFGAGSGPPCVYAGVHRELGAYVGNYKDEKGVFSSLAEARIEVSSSQGRVVEGSFETTYDHPNGARIDIRGTFRACRTLFPPCSN